MSRRLLPLLVVLVACGEAADGAGAGAQAGRVADPCVRDADCQAGLLCLKLGPEGFCGKTCGPTEGCPAEGDNVCVRMNPASYGDWCLRRCVTAEDCGEGLTCRDLAVAADYGVCFP